jgi:hypothetical protein
LSISDPAVAWILSLQRSGWEAKEAWLESI